jgi:hypothetical protein
VCGDRVKEQARPAREMIDTPNQDVFQGPEKFSRFEAPYLLFLAPRLASVGHLMISPEYVIFSIFFLSKMTRLLPAKNTQLSSSSAMAEDPTLLHGPQRAPFACSGRDHGNARQVWLPPGPQRGGITQTTPNHRPGRGEPV